MPMTVRKNLERDTLQFSLDGHAEWHIDCILLEILSQKKQVAS